MFIALLICCKFWTRFTLLLLDRAVHSCFAQVSGNSKHSVTLQIKSQLQVLSA